MASRGWFLFLVGLLLSSFLGGGLRLYLSPQRVRAWVETTSAKRQPKFTLEFSSVRVSMADGFLPGLAVEFKDLKLKPKDQCVTGSDVVIDRLSIPIPISSLFNKQLRFGLIRADRLDFRYRPKNCQTEISIPKAVAGDSMESVTERIEDYLSKKWTKDLRNTFEILEGVSVKEFRLYLNDSVDPTLSLMGVEAQQSQGDREASFKFGALPGFHWTGSVAVGPIQSEIKVSPTKLSFVGKGNLVEGQFSGKMDWTIEDSVMQFSMDSRDIPAGPLLRLWNRWGLVAWSDPQIKNEWFKCRLTGTGSSRAWDRIPVALESCSFYGDLGRVIIHDAEVELLQGRLYPLTADLQDVTGFGPSPFWAIEFNPSSRIDGRLEFQTVSDIQFQGQMKNPGLKLTQAPQYEFKGESVDFTWARQNLKNKIELSNWVSEGLKHPIEIRLNDSASGTDLQLSWDSRFDEIPNLIDSLPKGSKWKDLKSSGEATWGKDALAKVEGQISAARMGLDDFQIERPQLDFKFQANKGRMEFTASDLRGLSTSPLRILGRIFELTTWATDEHRNVKLNVDFESLGRWVVNPFSFVSAENKTRSAVLIGRGYGSAIDEGLFTVREGSKIGSKFQIFGTLAEPRVEVPDTN